MSVKSKRVVIEHGKVAVYCRVAREDDTAIENQKQTLTAYANERGLGAVKLYIDNGASGNSFDRPAMSRLIADIETGTVGTVVVKNFSRLSRNAIEIGRFIENTLPKYGVRLIAISDNYDSANRENDIGGVAALKAMVREYYRRDHAARIKAGKLAKAGAS